MGLRRGDSQLQAGRPGPRRRARLSSSPRTARTSKMPGEVVRPVRAARKRLRHGAELEACAFRKVRTAASVAVAVQSGTAPVPAAVSRSASCAFGGQQGRRLSFERQRPVGIEELRRFEQFDQSLGTLLQPGHGRSSLARRARRQFASRGRWRPECGADLVSRPTRSASRLRACNGR